MRSATFFAAISSVSSSVALAALLSSAELSLLSTVEEVLLSSEDALEDALLPQPAAAVVSIVTAITSAAVFFHVSLLMGCASFPWSISALIVFSLKERYRKPRHI